MREMIHKLRLRLKSRKEILHGNPKNLNKTEKGYVHRL